MIRLLRIRDTFGERGKPYNPTIFMPDPELAPGGLIQGQSCYLFFKEREVIVNDEELPADLPWISSTEYPVICSTDPVIQSMAKSPPGTFLQE